MAFLILAMAVWMAREIHAGWKIEGQRRLSEISEQDVLDNAKPVTSAILSLSTVNEPGRNGHFDV